MKLVLGLACALLIAACGGEGAPATDENDAIDRELFVQTYVQLRMASFDNRPAVITDGERDSILDEQEVSDEDMRHFVNVHGSDLPFMRDLWADIEAQILSLLSPDADSVSPSGSAN